MTFTRTDILNVSGIAGGMVATFAGLSACNIMAKKHNGNKWFWWNDAQLVGCGALTAGIAAATIALSVKVLKAHH